MPSSDDTTTEINPDNPEDKMVILTRKDILNYFSDIDQPGTEPLEKNRNGLISRLRGFFK